MEEEEWGQVEALGTESGLNSVLLRLCQGVSWCCIITKKRKNIHRHCMLDL